MEVRPAFGRVVNACIDSAAACVRRGFGLAWILTLAALFSVGASAYGQGGESSEPIRTSVRVGGEYSDNRDGSRTNKQGNLDAVVEPRLEFRYSDADRTLLGVSFAPALKWHSNPRTGAEGGAQNDSELFGAIEVQASHRPTQKTTLTAVDTISYSDDPAVSEGGVVVRNSAGRLSNSARAGLLTEFSPTIAGAINGESTVVRYDDSALAKEADARGLSADAKLFYLFGSGISLFGALSQTSHRTESADGEDRISTVSYLGGVRRDCERGVAGSLSSGYETLDYDDPAKPSGGMINSRIELTFQPASALRCRLSGGYGFTALNLGTNLAQKTFSMAGGVDRDFMAGRLTVGLQGQYSHARSLLEGDVSADGSEEMLRVSMGLTFRLGRKMLLTGGYAFEDWQSDFRESFDRNLLSVGWSAEL